MGFQACIRPPARALCLWQPPCLPAVLGPGNTTGSAVASAATLHLVN